MKTVLITGGSRGIGASCVKYFEVHNYNVIFTYLNNELEAKKLCNEKVHCYKCDISVEADVKKLFMDIKKKYNNIDVLVNNAGISLDNELDKKSVDEFKKVINVNLIGTFCVSKYFSKIINKGGSIINIASNDGIDNCYKEEMDYAASKAGIISLTKTFAKELAPNIRVNAVAPGWVETDMAKKDIFESELEFEKDYVLLHRLAVPLDIAKVIYFLASDEASYINGEIVKVDGGY